MREFGLILFLIGAGCEGGAGFVDTLIEQGPILFVYGMIMTLVPMIVGYLFAKKVLKLPILNNMGALCGGMTSTPALGSLIQVAGTDDVASALCINISDCTCNSCTCGADDSAVVLILIKKQSITIMGCFLLQTVV